MPDSTRNINKPSSILPNSVQRTENKFKASVLKNPDMVEEYDSNVQGQKPSNERGAVTSDIQKKVVQGRDVLNSLHPDEIEFYACALELVDSADVTAAGDFFSFPVMISSVNESFQNLSSIKKTMSGVVVNKNQSFIPFNISINGDFGRRFRNVYDSSKVTAVTGSISKKETQTSGATGTNFFDTDNKTGYGSTKILERILRQSLKADSHGRPYNLYFYNLSFNSFFNVEVISMNFSQSKDKNMIWSYNIVLRAIAPSSVTQVDTASKIATLRNMSVLLSETRRQTITIGDKTLDPHNKLSLVEKQLYKAAKWLQGNAEIKKFAKNNKEMLNAIDDITKLAKNQNRIFIATVGVNTASGIQRLSAFRKSII